MINKCKYLFIEHVYYNVYNVLSVAPDKWHILHEKCTGANPRQSPIDIEPMNTIFEDDLTKIELIEHYSKYRKLKVTNNGHSGKYWR